MEIKSHRIDGIWYKQSANIGDRIKPTLLVTHYTTGWSGQGSRDWLLGAAGRHYPGGPVSYRRLGGSRQPWELLQALVVALLLALAMGGCAIRLVPAYDPALVEALDGLNVRTLSLFGALDGGAGAAGFSAYEDRYADLIGGFEALVMRAEARPVPQLAGKLAKLRVVAELCGGDDAAACVNSSPGAMAEIVATLAQMRDVHRARGLPEELRQGFKRSYQISIHQAMTVETALSR